MINNVVSCFIYVTYRSFIDFNEKLFLDNLSNSLSLNITNYDLFKSIFKNVFNKHVPRRSRLIRGIFVAPCK